MPVYIGAELTIADRTEYTRHEAGFPHEKETP